MYLDQFGLQENPFRLAPDPRFLFLSKQHARARAYMESTVWFTDGFVVVTGEIGSGKTTLIEDFLSNLDDSVTVARIAQTQLTPVEFLQTVLAQFGFQPFAMGKAELLETLNRLLEELLDEGRKVVIVIDEAQNLDRRVLEEIRMLSGVCVGREKVLSIILAGQPELADILDAPDMEQLAQRTRLRFHLRPLAEEEIGAYIAHRIEIAGGRDPSIFAPETFPDIYRYTGGVPRLINTLCDTALICAFADEQPAVDTASIQQAISELGWPEFAQRSGRRSGPSAPVRTAQGEAVGYLVLTRKGRHVADFPLREGRSIVGRTRDNDIPVDSQYISRHHAQVICDRDGILVEDLRSTNGIHVGARRVDRQRLGDGESFSIGEFEFTFRRLNPESEAGNAMRAGREG
jgi:type II secretory pathway predicted ATPase ExeA